MNFDTKENRLRCEEIVEIALRRAEELWRVPMKRPVILWRNMGGTQGLAFTDKWELHFSPSSLGGTNLSRCHNHHEVAASAPRETVKRAQYRRLLDTL
jgi:hypothetical protein